MELPESAGAYYLEILFILLNLTILVSTAPPQLRQKENKNKKRNMIKFKRHKRENGKINVENGKDVTEDNLNNNLTGNSSVSDINPLHTEVRRSFNIFFLILYFIIGSVSQFSNHGIQDTKDKSKYNFLLYS